MRTTDKETCRLLIEQLVAHGVSDAILSPGSRNTPLIIAAHRNEKLRTHIVIDERCAAFFALGMALQTGKPVAMICTSGSAILNYGPAIAEAYYRRVPLIAISADRPAEWIDQDDSQTIRQSGVLGNIVKGSFDINGENGDRSSRAFARRSINDALILASKGPQGPVHINVRLDEPLGNLSETAGCESRAKIEMVDCEEKKLSTDQYDSLANRLKGKRVMVIAGFGRKDSRRDKSIDEFVNKSGAVVLHEAQSNVHLTTSVGNIDATLVTFTDKDSSALRPDIVISFGGAILSRFIKQYLRSSADIEHWHIAESTYAIDCFMSLSKRIEANVACFFSGMAKACGNNGPADMGYLSHWLAKSQEGKTRVSKFYDKCLWSDFKAMGRLIEIAPKSWNLHFSNGTAVRYAQLFDYSEFNDIECNRGVSGIDGATSTAVGAHVWNNDVTLLVSGDMSAQYDSGALALTQITPRMKIAVLNNNGGGIFRFIKSTSHLEECEKCFVADVRLPLKDLARAYGFKYFEVSAIETFDSVFESFAGEKRRPAILNIITPPSESAELLKEFFK